MGRLPLWTCLASLLVLSSRAQYTSKDDPDPTCTRGILQGMACCPASCGQCGGSGCGHAPGGSSVCCGSNIDKNRSCGMYPAPCIVPTEQPQTACGDYPALLSKAQPNVLLVGDSISMPVPYTPGGYGANARKMLAKLNISVWHNGGWQNGGQASNTVKGLNCTDPSTHGNWLNVTGTYDVIHFNFGLHDLVDPGPGEGKQHVDADTYGRNLVEVFARFASRAKRIIFATTTPCPNVTTSMGRSDAKVRIYNAAALAAVKGAATKAEIPMLVDDLYGAVDDYCGKDYKQCDLQRPGNVHFEPKGCQFMADRVVDSVLKALNGSSVSLRFV